MADRAMTPGEIEMVRPIYGDGIDYSRVRVFDRKGMGLIGNMFIDNDRPHAPNGNVYFPGRSYSPDFSAEPAKQHDFIHELAHVWQAQHGEWVKFKALVNRNYDYGAVFKGMSFKRLGVEQKAHMIEDYFTLKKGKAVTDGYGHVVDTPPPSEYERLLPLEFLHRSPMEAPIPIRRPDPNDLVDLAPARHGTLPSGPPSGRRGSYLGNQAADRQSVASLLSGVGPLPNREFRPTPLPSDIVRSTLVGRTKDRFFASGGVSRSPHIDDWPDAGSDVLSQRSTANGDRLPLAPSDYSSRILPSPQDEYATGATQQCRRPRCLDRRQAG